MAVDGNILIRTKIDGKGFNDGMKSMMGGLGKLATALGVTFGIAGIVAFGKKSVETATEMEASWQGLNYILNANGRSIQRAKEFLEEYTEDGLVPMLNAQNAYRNMIARGYDTSQIEDMLKVFKDSSVYLRRSQYEIGESIEATTMGLRTERSILSDAAGIEQNMYKMWQSYAKQNGTTIANMTLAEKRVAEYNAVMQEGAIYAGAAAAYTETYAGRVAKLSAAMVSLKVSVGNALIPILNQLMPVLMNIVNWFTRLFNIVGRVLNMLFGTSVSAVDASPVEEAADAYGDMADEIDKAGKAAKGSLASFDKLNVLSQPSGGSGGDGGTPVIEEPEIPDSPIIEKLDELEERLRRFVEEVKAVFATGDISFISEWLSGAILSGINTLREKIQGVDFRGIVRGMAANLNLAIGGFDWKGVFGGLGGLLSDGVKGALDAVIGFVQGFDWGQFTGDVWDGIAGFLEGVDWGGIVSRVFELLGSALVAVATIIGTLAEKIDGVVQGIADYFREKIAEKGGDFWAGLWQGIKDAAVGIYEWIKEHVVKPFIDAFKKAFGIASPSTVMAEQGSYLIDGLKQGIVDAWGNIKVWFEEKILKPIKEAFKTAWDSIKKWAEDTWTDIRDAWNGASTWFVSSVIQPVKGFFEGLWQDVSGYFVNLWEGIKTVWSNVAGWFDTYVVSPIKSAVNSIIELVNGMISGIERGLNWVINGLNNIGFDIPSWLGGGHFGLNIPPVSFGRIPMLATGAVIPPNAPFAAILGDQKHGRNIEAPEDLLRQIVREEMGGMNSQPQTIHNVLKLDGRVVYESWDKENRRVGSSMLTKGASI